jgi:hypothetical protein
MKALLIHVLAWLLHHANRSVKHIFWNREDVKEFYTIKDVILKEYADRLSHEVQHLPGVRCRSCSGRGYHTKYSMYPPYKAFDWPDCWSCGGDGWYKLPQWNLLQKVRLGNYFFHMPVKREERIKNPWTIENMGFQVTSSPIIEGYIEHEETRYGEFCMLALTAVYHKQLWKKLVRTKLQRKRWSIERNIRAFKEWVKKLVPVIEKQRPKYTTTETEDLPF